MSNEAAVAALRVCLGVGVEPAVPTMSGDAGVGPNTSTLSAQTELEFWLNREATLGRFPDSIQRSAVNTLATDNLPLLLELLSSATIPEHGLMLVGAITWTDELTDKWLSSSSSHSVLALGLLRALRADGPSPS